MASAFPHLTTRRLSLRSMEPRDAEGYAELLSDPSTYPFITDSGPIPAAEIPERILRNGRTFDEGRAIYWSAVLETHFVGYFALYGHRTPEPALGYAIRPAWRRQGLAAEALRVIADYCFSTLGTRELVARTHLDNRASANLLIGLGYRELGPVMVAQGERLEFRASPG